MEQITVEFACSDATARSSGRGARRCELLAWAASGGMALTGWPDRAPRPPPAPLIGRVARLAAAVGEATSHVGDRVDVDVSAALFGRAALLGATRAGRTSAGGSCELLRSSDGWVAVNLARLTDVEAVPALLGRAVTDPWAAIAEYAGSTPGRVVAARAQELGIAAAEVGAHGARLAPCRVRRVGARRPPPAVPLVVDLSAMWAGPLVAALLGRSGARVVKVETATRPDGARGGPPAFFDTLHGGHESVTLDLATTDGRARLGALLHRADVVIESARPRGLAQLGFDAEALVRARPGLTWTSITAYGRAGPWSNRVGFGDDAAAAAGLLARDADGDPVFCGDAVADPIAGLLGALGTATTLARGGGALVDVSLAGAAASLAEPAAVPPRRHRVTAAPGGGWYVEHGTRRVPVAPPRPERPSRRAEPAGASTGRVLAELAADVGGPAVAVPGR